jgi:hypothetical protein
MPNLACELEADGEQNQLKLIHPQVVTPMIKAILLEPNHLVASIQGHNHY